MINGRCALAGRVSHRGRSVWSVSENTGADQAPDPTQNAEKDPETWVTGDEPMTGPQKSYLQTLAREAGRDLPEDLTKAQASELIDELQGQTGRGQ